MGGRSGTAADLVASRVPGDPNHKEAAAIGSNRWIAVTSSDRL